MYKVRIPEHLRDLSGTALKEAMRQHREHEIEKLVNTHVDVPKARSFQNINSGVTTYDIGNYLNITNVYGTPDISFISGETTPYKQISLFDVPTVTPPTPS